MGDKIRVLFTNEAPLIKLGLAEGFRQAGYEVRVIAGEQERLWNHSFEEQVKRLEKRVEEFKPDFVFTEGYPGCNPLAIFNVLKKHSIPHLYWAIEDPVSPDLAEQFLAGSDIIFTTTKERVPYYQGKGKPSEVLLFGCNPEFHKQVPPKTEYKHDIVLVAANYSSRYEESKWFVMPFLERGYDIKIYGIWWDDYSRPVNLKKYPEKYGGILAYENLPAIYNSAKVILGMNCDDTSNTQTSMRPYEALACGGGLFLAHYTKAQWNIFGYNMWQAKNTNETLRYANELLAMSDAQRQERAFKAQQFVYKNHNYMLRANQIVDAFRRKV